MSFANCGLPYYVGNVIQKEKRLPIARKAGLKIGSTGGIRVDDSLRTSDPAIWAVGDAMEVRDFVAGEPCLVLPGRAGQPPGRYGGGRHLQPAGQDPGCPGDRRVCRVSVAPWRGIAKTDALLLDVRTPAECHGGVVDGAVDIPLHELRSSPGELPRDREIWVNRHAGLQSYIACRMLLHHGFQARNLSGGYHTYRGFIRIRPARRSRHKEAGGTREERVMRAAAWKGGGRTGDNEPRCKCGAPCDHPAGRPSPRRSRRQ